MTAGLVKSLLLGLVASLLASGAAAQGTCYTPAELQAWRVRALWQQFVNATLECQGAAEGSRLGPDDYNAFVAKFKIELAENGVEVRAQSRRRGLDFNDLATDLAGRMSKESVTDGQFCARSRRAMDLALGPGRPKLSELPSTFDLALINVRPCP